MVPGYGMATSGVRYSGEVRLEYSGATPTSWRLPEVAIALSGVFGTLELFERIVIAEKGLVSESGAMGGKRTCLEGRKGKSQRCFMKCGSDVLAKLCLQLSIGDFSIIQFAFE
jgi:hypothetical protein